MSGGSICYNTLIHMMMRVYGAGMCTMPPKKKRCVYAACSSLDRAPSCRLSYRRVQSEDRELHEKKSASRILYGIVQNVDQETGL